VTATRSAAAAPNYAVSKDLVESVILHSARPTLVLPYAGRFDTIGSRVMVAWNVLRRTAPTEGAAPEAITRDARRDTFRFAGWELDVAARRLVSPQRQDVTLTTGEFDLLCTFAKHPGRVLSRDLLLEQTRGREAGPYDRTVDVQVGHLGKKLGDDGDDPKTIKSVRSAGYVLVPPVVSG